MIKTFIWYLINVQDKNGWLPSSYNIKIAGVGTPLYSADAAGNNGKGVEYLSACQDNGTPGRPYSD